MLEVTRWEATAGEDAIELDADPRSLEVREASGGVKPLTAGDRDEIHRNIDRKVLGRAPIAFRSTHVERSAGGGRLSVQGQLSMAGSTRPVTAELDTGADGHVTGTIVLTQSDWGIRPYRGLMGALRVRDDVDVEIDVRTGPARSRTGSA